MTQLGRIAHQLKRSLTPNPSRGWRRGIGPQVDVSMPALRAEQLGGVAKDLLQSASLSLQFDGFAEIKKSLQVHLDQRKLPQRHVQRFDVLSGGAILRVQLDSQAGAGDAIAELMRQAAADLA